MRLRSIVLASLVVTAASGCGKKEEGTQGPAVSEADKTAAPSDAQCDAYAAKSVEVEAMPANMKDYAKEQCLKGASVALVKCVETAKKTPDFGDCLSKYPMKP